MPKYRSKIYRSYSSNRPSPLAPRSTDGFTPRAPYLRKLIREHLPADAGARILDIGCGHGAWLYFAAQAGYRNLRGIDASEEQVREARRLGIAGVAQANLVDYLKGVEDGSLDALIAFDVIEHFTKDELTDLVDEFYRVLKPGGRVISHQPNSEGPFGSFMRHWDFTHELGFTRQLIAQLFLSSGFATVRSFEDKPVVHGVKSLVRFIGWEYAVRPLCQLVRLVETGAWDRDAIFSQNFLMVAVK